MTSTVTETAQSLNHLSLTGDAPLARDVWFSQSGLPESAYPYKHFLPSFGDRDLPPLTEFEHVDPGHEALKADNPRSFLSTAKVDDLSPRFGSVVEGVQLHKLDTAARQQLALYVAQRGVVVRPSSYLL